MVSRPKPRSTRPPKRTSFIRKRSDLVAEVTRVLEASRGDVAAMLSRVARACVPDLGEMFIVDVVQDDGTLDRVDAEHVDPSHTETMRAMRGPFMPSRDHPLTRVIASGRPMLERVVDARGLARIARDPTHLVLLRRFGPRSSMRVPLVLGGRTAAVLTFCLTEPSRRYSPSDMALARQIVARVADAAGA